MMRLMQGYITICVSMLVFVCVNIFIVSPGLAGERGALGISIQDAMPEELGPNPHGVKVVEVRPNSAGAIAGLRAADIIVGLDEFEVVESKSFAARIAEVGAGATVKLTIYRGGSTTSLYAVLAAAPPHPAPAATAPPVQGPDLCRQRCDFDYQTTIRQLDENAATMPKGLRFAADAAKRAARDALPGCYRQCDRP